MMKKKMEEKKELLTRGDLMMLYQTLKNIKSGSLTKEPMLKYVKLRVALMDVASDFDKMREEVSNQTKPEGWQDGDSTQEWDKAFQDVMSKWTTEPVELNTHIFTENECIDLIMSNPDIVGAVLDVIMYKLSIK